MTELSSNEVSDDEKVEAPNKTSGSKPVTKDKTPAKPSKKVEDDDDEDEDDDDDEVEDKKPTKAKPEDKPTKAKPEDKTTKAKKNDTDDEDEENHDVVPKPVEKKTCRKKTNW